MQGFLGAIIVGTAPQPRNSHQEVPACFDAEYLVKGAAMLGLLQQHCLHLPSMQINQLACSGLSIRCIKLIPFSISRQGMSCAGW